MTSAPAVQVRQLYIPSIGDTLTLATPWRFTLYPEHRNLKFWQAMGLQVDPDGRWGYWGDEMVKRATEVKLPAGTVLKIDRIYIRKGKDMGKFDSVTFLIPKPANKGLNVHGRFWVKLIDVNAIEFEV